MKLLIWFMSLRRAKKRSADADLRPVSITAKCHPAIAVAAWHGGGYRNRYTVHVNAQECEHRRCHPVYRAASNACARQRT